MKMDQELINIADVVMVVMCQLFTPYYAVTLIRQQQRRYQAIGNIMIMMQMHENAP